MVAIYRYSLLAARVVPHVLADVVAGDGQHHGVAALLQQVDEGTEQLLAAFVEASGVLAPELSRFVHWRPFEAETKRDFNGQCGSTSCTMKDVDGAV